jgi:hypothetical protein
MVLIISKLRWVMISCFFRSGSLWGLIPGGRLGSGLAWVRRMRSYSSMGIVGRTVWSRNLLGMGRV